MRGRRQARRARVQPEHRATRGRQLHRVASRARERVHHQLPRQPACAAQHTKIFRHRICIIMTRCPGTTHRGVSCHTCANYCIVARTGWGACGIVGDVRTAPYAATRACAPCSCTITCRHTISWLGGQGARACGTATASGTAKCRALAPMRAPPGVYGLVTERARTRVVRGDDLRRGGEPGLGVHAHARVVARPQAVALHPVLDQLGGHLARRAPRRVGGAGAGGPAALPGRQRCSCKSSYTRLG